MTRLSTLVRPLLAATVMFLVAAAMGVASGPTPVQAQSTGEATQVVIFIIDLSGSMNESFDDGRTKLDVAKEAFAEAFADIRTDAVVGLRVYGNQLDSTAPANREENCTVDTEVLQEARPLGETDLISVIDGLEAKGDTSIALALESADLQDIPDGALGTIVLFSDGRDECFDADLDGDPESGPSWGKDPCDVARAIAGEGVELKIDRIETVGFRAGPEAEQELRCIADVSGGSFTKIETPEDAREILPDLLSGIASLDPPPPVPGLAISGAPDQGAAPVLLPISDPSGAAGHFEDEISINSEQWYRVPEYGPGDGTFTATVFGLPAQEGISFSQRMYLPETDQTFFTEENADAGLPRRATASLRCPGCSVSGGPNEVYWIISLQSANPDLEGTFRLEIQTEGPAYGGAPINCQEPQACWYEGQISARVTDRDGLRESYDALLSEAGADVLVDQRTTLEADVEDLESRASEATTTRDDLVAQLDALGGPSTSLALPLALAGAGVVAGAAGGVLASRRRSPPPVEPTAERAPDTPITTDDSAVIGHIVSEERPVAPGPLGTTTPTKISTEHAAPREDPAAALAEATTVGPESLEEGTTEDWLGSSVYREELTEDLAAAEAVEAGKTVQPAAAWYPDPKDPRRLRWWDGSRWTAETAERQGGRS